MEVVERVFVMPLFMSSRVETDFPDTIKIINMKNKEFDVVIVGGSFGAIAAALALGDQNLSVALIDEFDWIGGQVSSQGLCVLDDMHDPFSEKVGVNRSYFEFRERVREYYRKNRKLSPLGKSQIHLNPGNALCSHLAAESHVAHRVILEWLQPIVDEGKLDIETGWKVDSMERDGSEVKAVVFKKTTGSATMRLTGKFFLDGTETGDTLPLLDLPYMKGCESKAEFGEPHAPEEARPESIQSITFCATVEWAPGEDNALPKPEHYEAVRDRQGFYLFSPGRGRKSPARMWDGSRAPNGDFCVPAWFYRSIIDPRNFLDGGKPRTVINVPGNDYHDEHVLENSDPQRVLAEARKLTQCYLYWLQNEAPRDEGGTGYPEIRIVPEATGTPDGIAMAPYVREARRLRAATIVREQDVHRSFYDSARARVFEDSVGLGGYWLDVHRCSGGGGGVWEPTAAYQIPLSAMVVPELRNFSVAGKCLGVTQIANGAYRLHPEEWAVGHAAGMLAAFMLSEDVGTLPLRGSDLHRYQQTLVASGVPLYWYEDLPFDHLAFEAIQMLGVREVWGGAHEHLRFNGEHSICRIRPEFHAVIKALVDKGVDVSEIRDIFDVAHNIRKYDAMNVLYQRLEEIAVGGNSPYPKLNEARAFVSA